ncbi:hypothetical protein HGM15179_003526 [Zosterops borbonicus]|uniref:Uncharacterized protein n=1 Tax=Zosterops borbonicus TaxID=364589 RepID=A0A8K1LRH3_9PASS|nr:hypothetical protein HGM15179_003526 [Zosterops borbonicus]
MSEGLNFFLEKQRGREARWDGENNEWRDLVLYLDLETSGHEQGGQGSDSETSPFYKSRTIGSSISSNAEIFFGKS